MVYVSPQIKHLLWHFELWEVEHIHMRPHQSHIINQNDEYRSFCHFELFQFQQKMLHRTPGLENLFY